LLLTEHTSYALAGCDVISLIPFFGLPAGYDNFKNKNKKRLDLQIHLDVVLSKAKLGALFSVQGLT